MTCPYCQRAMTPLLRLVNGHAMFLCEAPTLRSLTESARRCGASYVATPVPKDAP